MEKEIASSTKAGTVPSLSKGRILLVDDEADIAAVFKKGLTGSGFAVKAYSDPKKALADFRPDAFDLVILDVRMPGMSGIQLLKELKKIDGKIKALFMSSFEIQQEEWKMVLPGIEVSGFIQKPARISTIIDAVQKIKVSKAGAKEDQAVVRGTPAALARQLQTGNLFEPLSHNMLVYEDLAGLRQILASYAKTFLPKNEIVLFATQYDSIEDLKRYLKDSGVDVSRHLSDGTLLVIDAQHGYQGTDTYGTFKLAQSLMQRATKEKRNGITWFGDMGSFLAFDRAFDMLDYELYCPTKYDDVLKAVCCYHIDDFRRLSSEQKDRLLDHHHKTVFVE